MNTITSNQHMPNNTTNTNQTQFPKRYFRLTPFQSSQALSEIETYTNHFDPKYNIAQDFSQSLRESLQNNHTIYRGYIYAPPDHNHTKQIIGKQGCYFKLTTTNTNISFIWHDRDSNCFLFWGHHRDNLFKAMNIINHRINIVTSR